MSAVRSELDQSGVIDPDHSALNLSKDSDQSADQSLSAMAASAVLDLESIVNGE